MRALHVGILALNQLDKKWRTSVLVLGLITFIAAVHYFYMRDYWAANMESPTFFRYVDWILTVPLMCVEIYLNIKVAGAKSSLMWRLIGLSVVMLVTGYFGEAVFTNQAALWGAISSAAYFVIVYDIWLGSAKKLQYKTFNLGLYSILIMLFLSTNSSELTTQRRPKVSGEELLVIICSSVVKPKVTPFCLAAIRVSLL